MKLFLTASKDTYITNKIIDGKFRATDSNVGYAGTLDLFKLFNENNLTGTNNQDEISRLLVKFDYDLLSPLTQSKIDLNGGFNATLRLFDINSGHSVPSNFTIAINALSHSFDEGIGRDLSKFNDIDVCNFITSSVTSSIPVLWFSSGCNASGRLGDSNLDIIEYGNLLNGQGQINLTKTQFFTKGNENLSVDVTNLVSASLAGLIQNNGFRISFSGTDESDTKTRFVKRFGSRHIKNELLKPRLEINFDDSVNDNSCNFYFNTTGTLFLTNIIRSRYQNLTSGSSLTSITGQNCVILKLVKDNFSFYVTGSQHRAGTGRNYQTGIYSATFALNSNNNSVLKYGLTLDQLIARDKFVEFDVYWNSIDQNVCYHTGTLKINSNDNTTFSTFNSDDYQIYTLNLKSQYEQTEKVRIRLFARDLNDELKKYYKVPFKLKSKAYERCYYRIRDVDTNTLLFDFDTTYNSTKISTDTDGMFFDFQMNILPKERTYKFEFLLLDDDNQYIMDDRGTVFAVR